jgi:hypothetical protein
MSTTGRSHEQAGAATPSLKGNCKKRESHETGMKTDIRSSSRKPTMQATCDKKQATTMKRALIITLGVAASAIAIVALTGMYKFNVLQDDIFISGESLNEVDRNLLLGSWIETMPGSESEFQGFTLHHDGTATSINKTSVEYKRWMLNNGQLILTTISFGNQCSIIEDQVYTIEAVGSKRLLLKTSSTSQSYKKWQTEETTNS